MGFGGWVSYPFETAVCSIQYFGLESNLKYCVEPGYRRRDLENGQPAGSGVAQFFRCRCADGTRAVPCSVPGIEWMDPRTAGGATDRRRPDADSAADPSGRVGGWGAPQARPDGGGGSADCGGRAAAGLAHNAASGSFSAGHSGDCGVVCRASAGCDRAGDRGSGGIRSTAGEEPVLLCGGQRGDGAADGGGELLGGDKRHIFLLCGSDGADAHLPEPDSEQRCRSAAGTRSSSRNYRSQCRNFSCVVAGSRASGVLLVRGTVSFVEC